MRLALGGFLLRELLEHPFLGLTLLGRGRFVDCAEGVVEWFAFGGGGFVEVALSGVVLLAGGLVAEGFHGRCGLGDRVGIEAPGHDL